MALRRQTNVTLTLEMAEVMDEFARIFHRGEFAPVARVLIEEGLRHIRTKADYLAAIEKGPEIVVVGKATPEEELRQEQGIRKHDPKHPKQKTG